MQNEPKQLSGPAQPAPLLVTEVLPPAPASDLPPPAAASEVPPFLGGQKLPHGLSQKQIVAAFVIAGLSDGISGFAAFTPPIQWVVDVLTAAALFAVLGWRWLLLPGLIMEAVPGLGVVPFWVLVVSAISVWGSVRPRMN
jgi:hypothetical protein